MRRLRWFLRGFSWLLPANHFRLAILGAPIVLLWKGPYFVSSLHPREQAAEIRPAVSALECRPGESASIEVDLHNLRATVWLREARQGRGYVRLGAHLLDENGRMLDFDFARAALPADVPLHGKVRIPLTFDAPSVPAGYVLRLDMVNEGIGWFEDVGSPTVDVALTVGEL
jgi:hypothetical protein